MMSPPLIRIQALTKVYSPDKVPVTALKNIDLEIDEKLFTVIAGPSGSGKSTLLNLLGGLDTPTSGEIEVSGARISGMDKRILAKYRRFEVGMIFQSFNLIPSRTAVENVALPLVFAALPRKERRERASILIEKVGLGPRAHHRPGELSGGEQQRVAIARALVNHPRILLADEPTGNLDSATSGEVVRLLAELNREDGLTVVMVSHEQDLVQGIAHRFVRLRDGEIAGEERLA